MNDEITRRVDRRIDRARRVYEGHGKVFRVVWITAGVVVVLAGVSMTVVPGPVTVVVPAGLAMLAVVFGWARRLLLLEDPGRYGPGVPRRCRGVCGGGRDGRLS